MRLLDAPTIASKRWVFEQFDGTVRAGVPHHAGRRRRGPARGGRRFGLAMTVDCNARHVLLDPFEGGKGAVAEAARNIACTGARPLGITDCLNFGNPERPEVFFQFTEACRGISEACLAFNTPVTGGNVSLYNQSPTGAIEPTPTVGMVGLLADITTAVPSHSPTRATRSSCSGARRATSVGGRGGPRFSTCIGGAPPPSTCTRNGHCRRSDSAAAAAASDGRRTIAPTAVWRSPWRSAALAGPGPR